MTREEAIDIFDDNFTVIDTHGHYTDEEVEQVRQIAIEALEQEQCDKCEVGNPCLYCKHEFEPKESEDKE